MARKIVSFTLAPDVHVAIREKAAELGLSASRVVDHLTRKALGITPPVEKNPLDVTEPQSAA